MKRPALEAEVLGRIRPPDAEREHTCSVAGRLVEAVNRSGTARGMVVGSVARGTWISGDRDLDIFMLFEPSVPREELEREGLSLGRKIALELGAECREKYAEHPYVSTTFDGLDIDLVPCYAVSSAREIQSAVDRTPFHNRYVMDRIRGFEDDVLLAKQFAKAGGIYGSDQMTSGFSGYLCELLVLYYRGFSPLIAAAASWRPGTVIDPEHHQAKYFDEPLIVVDPVDPGRNVAASVSRERMFGFAELARGYLAGPSRAFFSPPALLELSKEEFSAELARRGTALFAMVFPTPPYIEEIVVPQLRKSLHAIRELLQRHEFTVNRTDCMMGPDESVLLFEILNDSLPPLRHHKGPPLWEAENADQFRGKYCGYPPGSYYSGPFIDEGLYFIEVPRRYCRAADLLRSGELLAVGLGRHVRRAMENSCSLFAGPECWSHDRSAFLSAFFFLSSPLVRIRRGEERCLPPSSPDRRSGPEK